MAEALGDAQLGSPRRAMRRELERYGARPTAPELRADVAAVPSYDFRGRMTAHVLSPRERPKLALSPRDHRALSVAHDPSLRSALDDAPPSPRAAGFTARPVTCSARSALHSSGGSVSGLFPYSPEVARAVMATLIGHLEATPLPGANGRPKTAIEGVWLARQEAPRPTTSPRAAQIAATYPPHVYPTAYGRRKPRSARDAAMLREAASRRGSDVASPRETLGLVPAAPKQTVGHGPGELDATEVSTQQMDLLGKLQSAPPPSPRKPLQPRAAQPAEPWMATDPYFVSAGRDGRPSTVQGSARRGGQPPSIRVPQVPGAAAMGSRPWTT